MEYDVFISYHTKSSLNVTKSICNELENRKIKCWYAPRDTLDEYANNIINVIERCKVFLLILNEESSNSFDVLNEINIVCERLRKKEAVHVIPFQISEGEISKDAKYYLGRFHWIDAITPPLEKRIKELADRIEYVLNNNVSASQSEYKYDNYLTALKSTAICNFTGFIGRKRELKEIEENIKNYGKVFLYGMGGIGKSELAKKYAKLNETKYDTIIFSVYENSLKDMILNDKFFYIENFKKKVCEDGSLESNDEFFIRKLNEIKRLSNEKTLIIIDNFNTDNKEELKLLIDGNYHLIFTTRNDFSYSRLPVITINQMEDKADLISLFEENYIIKLKEEDKEIVYEIINEIKGHTLVITLIASLMRLTRISPKKMLEKIKEGITPDIKGEVEYNFKDYDCIYNCIKTVFDTSNLTENEKDILMKMYFTQTSGIAFEEFMELADIEDGEDINKLINKSMILYNYVSDIISLHPLISSVIKNELNPNFETAKTIISNIASRYSWDLELKEKEKYIPLILSIYSKLPDFTINEATDYAKLSFYLRDVNEFKLSEEIIFKVLAISKTTNVSEEEMGNLYKEIEYLYYVQNDLEKAKEYTFKMMECGKAIGTPSYLLVEALNKLASIYVDEENADMAKKYNDECCEIMKDVPDLPATQYAFCDLCYCKIYYLLEDYDKALEYAISCHKKFSDINKYHNVSSALKMIGEIYLKKHDIPNAIKNLEECVLIREKYCKFDNIALLKCKVILASVYIEAKEFKKAYEILDSVNNILTNGSFNCSNLQNQVSEKLKLCNI